MTVQYGPQHAAEWAQFSGDINPIHFDVEKARAAGLDGLSVHGMRALLDMKCQLSQRVEMPAIPASYRFIARLREAVKCHTPYQLRCQNGQSQLSDPQTGRVCFSGKLEPMSDTAMETVSLTHPLSPQELSHLRKQYPGNSDSAQWCFLDAVLFRQMILTPEIVASVNEKLPQLKARTLADVFSQLQVVQTHHEVLFSSDLLESCLKARPKDDFYYGISPPLIMGDAETGLVLRLAMHGGYPAHSQITSVTTLKIINRN